MGCHHGLDGFNRHINTACKVHRSLIPPCLGVVFQFLLLGQITTAIPGRHGVSGDTLGSHNYGFRPVGNDNGSSSPPTGPSPSCVYRSSCGRLWCFDKLALVRCCLPCLHPSTCFVILGGFSGHWMNFKWRQRCTNHSFLVCKICYSDDDEQSGGKCDEHFAKGGDPTRSSWSVRWHRVTGTSQVTVLRIGALMELTEESAREGRSSHTQLFATR